MGQDDDQDDEGPPAAAAAAAREGKRSTAASSTSPPKKPIRDDENNFWWEHLHPELIKRWLRTNWSEVYNHCSEEVEEPEVADRVPPGDSWMMRDGLIVRIHRQPRRTPLRTVSMTASPKALRECTWQATFCRLSEAVYQCIESHEMITGAKGH
eukprot:4076224-Amphidinium_carterae.5